MPTIFVDTSAILAFLVRTDRYHEAARQAFLTDEVQAAELVTSSCVVYETISLLQARVGIEAVRSFQAGVAPLFRTVWVDLDLYSRAMAALLAARSRGVSLTDWTSFEIMRQGGIATALTFDSDFSLQGFKRMPS